MKKARQSKLFLEALQTVPIVQVACEKTGISRNTVYRWRREDPKFAQKFDEAMNDGIAFVNDMSESQLLQLIKDRSFSAVRYWLNHHHDRFKKKTSNHFMIQSPEEKRLEGEKMLKEINRMHDLWFEDCHCNEND